MISLTLAPFFIPYLLAVCKQIQVPSPTVHDVDPPTYWLRWCIAWLWIPYAFNRYEFVQTCGVGLTRMKASGLYYLSELVEEHTVFAKRILTRLIYSTVLIQFLLMVVDRFPISLSLMSIGSHVIYAGNLRHFPIVKLTDPVFILSCGMVNDVTCGIWFVFFTS